MDRLRVQHCILNSVTRQYGSHPTSDLIGVDYIRNVPADTEFPRLFRKLELFVRFFAVNLRRCRVLITVTLLEPDGSDRRTVHRTVREVPNLGHGKAVYVDHGFKLVNVVLPGEGQYRIRVMRKVRRPWETAPGWQHLASEYFWVARAS